MTIIKKIILLALVTLMVGCDHQNPDGTYGTSKSLTTQTIVIDSCEYIFQKEYKGYEGYGFLAHKGNCRFCRERDSIKWEKRKKELKELVEQLKEK